MTTPSVTIEDGCYRYASPRPLCDAELRILWIDLCGWGVNLNLEHSWDLTGGHIVSFGVLSHWQSKSELEFHNFANTRQEAYSRTDANLSWADGQGRYKVTAFVRNVEDDAILTGAALTSDTDPAAPGAGTLAPPRTFGVRVDFAF